MNFVQKKRKSDAASKDIVDLQLMRGALMQPVVRPKSATEHSFGSNEDGSRSISSGATVATTAFNNNHNRNSSAYVGITSGRGHAQSEVGIAWIDIESPSIKLIQMSDDHWYTGLLNKLNVIQPAQIIVPQTIFDAKPETADGKLIKYLREQFPMFPVIKIPRRNFSDTDGNQFINKYCSKKFNHVIQLISSKYYALSAVAGLMKYLLHSVHVNFRENSLKLEFDTKYGHLLMDVETTYTLELLSGGSRNRMKNIHLSLYDILDQCVTSIGKRTLRAKILEPSCDVPYIKWHQQCIAELNSRKHIELKSLLAGILKQFNYVERLHKLALVVPQDDNIRAAEVLINQTIQLRTCLQLVPVLRAKLEPLQSHLIQDIFNALSDERYKLMLDIIDTVLNKELIVFRSDSSSQLTQRIHCIQPGKCKIVDMLRDIYTKLIGELQDYVTNLSSRCGQAFKMHYDVTHGYHVRLMVAPNTSKNDFPPEFNVLSLKRNLCSLTTSEINKLNIRLKSVTEEITMQSNVVLAFMLSEIVTEIDTIYDLSGFVATLDNLVSLASISARDDYVCPTFTDEIRIVDAVHPLLEGNVRSTTAVPNNIIATPDYNFYIITGPNMSGKTVYLKMIAILQIMAQLGCYVPAKSATLRVTDRIFTRIGSNDSIEKNASSFVLEVNMTEHILKNVTANSLVIIDELYRSTNPKEGLQLAWSFCEHLISKRGKAMSGEFFEKSFSQGNDGESPVTNTSADSSFSKISEITAPFVYLTTHYHNLTKLADWYFNVVNLSFNADDVSDSDGKTHLNYSHRIQEGVTAVESYGLKLAESVRFPPSIVPKAKLIYRDLKAREELEDTVIRRNGQRKCSDLAESLAALRINELNTAQSVVSAVMTGPQNHSKRNGAIRSRLSSRFSTTTSNKTGDRANAVDDSVFMIDKVLYNLYSDIASALRNCETESAMQDKPRPIPFDGDVSYCSSDMSASGSNISSNDSKTLEERQNEAILECLTAFMSEQSNVLTEAIIDGLKERAVDLMTIPTESHFSQANEVNPNASQVIEDMEPCARPNGQPPVIGNRHSQRSQSPCAPSNDQPRVDGHLSQRSQALSEENLDPFAPTNGQSSVIGNRHLLQRNQSFAQFPENLDPCPHPTNQSRVNGHSSQRSQALSEFEENLNPFAPPNGQSAATGNRNLSQRSQNSFEFAIPSSVRSLKSQQSVLSTSQKPFLQKSCRPMSAVYETPHNSPFEFDASPRPRPQSPSDWLQGFGETSAPPFTQNSNFRGDRFDFVSPVSAVGSPYHQPSMASANGPIGRSHSLFNISTQINPHLEFDSVRASRSGAGGSGSRQSNNSENKYAKPFKSIQSDSKLCKSNPKQSRASVVSTPTMTKATPATIERTQATGSAAQIVAAPSGTQFGFQHSTKSNGVNRQAQSKQRSKKQHPKDKFESSLMEFYQSEQFQHLHRIANSVCPTTVSRPSTAPNEDASKAKSTLATVSPDNENISNATPSNGVASTVPLSPFPETCVLPPPPGF